MYGSSVLCIAVWQYYLSIHTFIDTSTCSDDVLVCIMCAHFMCLCVGGKEAI